MIDFSKVLLTVDYDRTLTGPDSVVPQRNIDAINWFIRQGGSFTVNTGRGLNTFGAHMKTIPANAPFLLYNGSLAYYNGEFVYAHPIDLDMWEVLDLLAEEFPALNLEVQGLYNHYLVNQKQDYIAFYEAQGWSHAPATPQTDMGPFVKFALFGRPYENAISTMFDGDPEDLALFDRAEARIRQLWGDKVVTYRAAPRIIDIHAKGVSKLIAARDLQARLGKEILVCVGDAENDIAMLDGADYAFCPADGMVSDRYENVCNCADGAVADVIYEKIPEILRKHP